MAERDAFGREIGEDPLAGLGWRTERTPDPPTAQAPAAEPDPPVMTAAPPQPQFSPPATVRYRRRRGGGRFLVLLVVLSIAVAAAGGIFSVAQMAGDAVDDLQGAIREAVPTAVAPPPTGTEAGSLLRTRDLRAALAKLPPGDIVQIRVAPERIDAQVADGGQMQLVQVRADGGVTTVTSPVSNPGRPVKVNAAAPARIVRTAARRAGRDPDDVAYLVLMRPGPRAEWQLFFGDGLHFSANASGRKVRRIG